MRDREACIAQWLQLSPQRRTRAIYRYLVEHAEWEGVISTTHKEIGEGVGISHPTVAKYVRDLIKVGLLRCLSDIAGRRQKDGTLGPHIYKLVRVPGHVLVTGRVISRSQLKRVRWFRSN